VSEAKAASALDRGQYFGYALGSVGTGIYNTVPGLLLLYYMTDTLGISAWLAGLAIFVPKLWDVVTDPWMGSISDRSHTRWGRRRPWLLLGGLTLPPLFALMFMTPDFAEPMLRFAWVTGFYVLCATAFTIFAVPYISMPAEMTDDYHETTTLMAWRMALLTLGVLVSGALAPVLVEQIGGGGRAGYATMSTIIAVVLAAAMIGTFFGTRRAPQRERTANAPPFWSTFRQALRVKPFAVLTSGYFLQHAGVGAVLAVVPYFASYVLQGDDLTVTILFVCLVGPAFAAMPLWVVVSKRIGKLRGYIVAMLLFGGFGASLWFASPGNIVLVYVQVAMMGIGWAGTELFPFSMLPDVIASDREASGQRREGVFTGLWMAVDKGALAVGALCTSLVLDGSGFLESEAEQVVVQPASALSGIRICAALLPAIFVVLSLPIVRRYSLDRETRRSTSEVG
jgi:GPH family glycoside/pentoside/hexuronide:cation symporter